MFERYIWPLELASHWLADFCKYHTEFVEINYYYNAAFSNCDSQQQQANQLLSLATKGQPLPSLETVPFFKEVDGLCRLPIGVLCSQRKLAPLSHMYSTTSTPTSNTFTPADTYTRVYKKKDNLIWDSFSDDQPSF